MRVEAEVTCLSSVYQLIGYMYANLGVTGLKLDSKKY